MSDQKEFRVDVRIKGNASIRLEANSPQEALRSAKEEYKFADAHHFGEARLEVSQVLWIEDLGTAEVFNAKGKLIEPISFEDALEQYHDECSQMRYKLKQPLQPSQADSYRRGSKWVLCSSGNKLAEVYDCRDVDVNHDFHDYGEYRPSSSKG